MKKVIPVIVAIALIIIVVGVSFGKEIYDKYSYGQDWEDLNEYYTIISKDQVPIVLNSAIVPESGKEIDGALYFDYDTVCEYFTGRFYIDLNENLLLYTNPETTFVTEIGTDVYSDGTEEKTFPSVIALTKGDTLYIAVDYVKKFVNFSYERFEDPLRMVIYTEWDATKYADINKETKVRKKGGVKALILCDIAEGDTVEILEPMDEWTKVMTHDGFIGYVENKRLTNEREETPVAVTDVPEETFTSLRRDHKINLTWHNMEYPQGGAELRTAMNYVESVNVVSPTWFYLTDNDGNFKSLGNTDYVNAAHNMGAEVWALISNFHSGVDVSTLEVLSYTSKRKALIDSLVATTLSFGADGINLDFENMDSATTYHFVQFVRELSLECHKNNLVLSVDNYVPTEYTAHYNRREQGLFADYLIIMGYDEHYAGSPVAGSVSSIPWMQKGIEDTVALVGAEKVINAVPFYTRVWKETDGEVKSEAIDMKVQADFIARNGLTTTWNEETYQNYGEFESGGTNYKIWLEDTDSLSVRLNVMETLNIAGIASWCLGQETPDVWPLISAYMQR